MTDQKNEFNIHTTLRDGFLFPDGFSMSNEIGALAGALAEAQKDFETIKKTGEVDYTFGGKRTNYKFADYAAVVAGTRSHLSKNGLALLHDSKTLMDGAGSTATILIHKESGQWIKGSPVVVAKSGNKAQDIMAALTYSMRYSECSFLGVATEDEDVDGPSEPTEPSKFGSKPEHVDMAYGFFNKFNVDQGDRVELMNKVIELNPGSPKELSEMIQSLMPPQTRATQ